MRAELQLLDGGVGRFAERLGGVDTDGTRDGLAGVLCRDPEHPYDASAIEPALTPQVDSSPALLPSTRSLPTARPWCLCLCLVPRRGMPYGVYLHCVQPHPAPAPAQICRPAAPAHPASHSAQGKTNRKKKKLRRRDGRGKTEQKRQGWPGRCSGREQTPDLPRCADGERDMSWSSSKGRSRERRHAVRPPPGTANAHSIGSTRYRTAGRGKLGLRLRRPGGALS
ncbi:hypothetical protein EDC01DRAFT_756574 [Geopyxis carbonaria]|nr:hypothetical protein EDC01DRAFT_756574 [Geopyxis carbonaria]